MEHFLSCISEGICSTSAGARSAANGLSYQRTGTASRERRDRATATHRFATFGFCFHLLTILLFLLGWLDDPTLLTAEAIELLIQTELEYQLRGHYQRIFPSSSTLAPAIVSSSSATASSYRHSTPDDSLSATRLRQPDYKDLLLEAWVRAWLVDHAQQPGL